MVTAALRAHAAAGWAFRASVEHDAAVRFERLAAVVSGHDPGSPVAALLWSAAQDERRHFLLCQGLAREFGAALPSDWPSEVPSIAPPALKPREAALYELVAASCITETESLATLTTLLPRALGTVERALREITSDEVRHAQLGWAHLARERTALDVSFLSACVPAMLAGTVDDALFAPPATPVLEDDGLYAFGLLPHTVKRGVFCRALDEVIFPGLAHHGVDVGPAKRWLDERRAR